MEMLLLGAGASAVVGYSFGDPHVNVFIAKWLSGLASRRLRIVNSGFQRCKTEFANDLRKLESTRAEIVSEGARVGLKSLYGDFVPPPIVESGQAVDPA